jgi:PIN like domain
MPSGANAARRDAQRLASLTFFLDHQIGRYQVAEMLRAAGAKVEVHLDHFLGDMPDVEWIPEVARRRWVLITKDQNIRRNPLEREAYRVAQLRDSSRRVRT